MVITQMGCYAPSIHPMLPQPLAHATGVLIGPEHSVWRRALWGTVVSGWSLFTCQWVSPTRLKLISALRVFMSSHVDNEQLEFWWFPVRPHKEESAIFRTHYLAAVTALKVVVTKPKLCQGGASLITDGAPCAWNCTLSRFHPSPRLQLHKSPLRWWNINLDAFAGEELV